MSECVGTSALFDGIYGIIDDGLIADPLAFGATLLEAGIGVLQYRAKRGVDRAVLRALYARTQRSNAILIVNDDLEAALEADGWHAGPEDLLRYDAGAARSRLGGRIFGISAGNVDEACAAQAAGADYLGTGPFAATTTKRNAGAAIGITGLRAVVAATNLPVVAIGGIGSHNLVEVATSGAAMAATISALAMARDPGATARAMIALWRSARA